jgi:hypothetical protein
VTVHCHVCAQREFEVVPQRGLPLRRRSWLCVRSAYEYDRATRVSTVTYLVATATLLVGCGGTSNSAPTGGTTRPTVTTTSGMTSGTSSESTASTQPIDSYLFEAETYSFRYPLEWQIYDPPPGTVVEGIPEEAVAVGPGTTSEALRVNVFPQETVLNTRAQEKQHLRDLVDEAQRKFDGIVEGPTLIEGPGGVRGVFISVLTRIETGKKVTLQEAFIYTGRLEYRLICQFASRQGDVAGPGCRQVLRTLKIDGFERIPAVG